MQPILKTKITDGVFWVEIPEAKVKILCASPADVVKHLKKRGFITTVEAGGYVYETGPNVLLLSDLAIQNSDFSNLGEFPILQMLYKQGMIIPNHPNNTGQKPIIVGSKDQLEAQMQYVFRGNYGLTSKEEILATGVSEADADMMMDVKLQFAFGKIHDSSTLVDSRVLESEEIEILNGVTIERRTTNIFIIRYKDYSTKVNLNLPPNVYYESPYPLGFHNLDRKFFSIIHSGQGDGWDINRPSMSSIIMYQGKIYLIDAGPNLDYILMTLGIGINEIEGIFHTHCHDDHFAGLVKLILADHRIKYYATPLVRHSVMKKFCALMCIEDYMFDEYFEVNDLDFDEWNNVHGMEVKPVYGPHPVETNLFYFRVPHLNGYKTYAHLADLSAFSILQNMMKKSERLDEEWFKQIEQNYLEPADIKKIDIGGGMIHGVAEDFAEDKSDKIILAHKESRLSTTEKDIGSSSPFGMVDELIPDYQDYTYRSAHYYMKTYFKNADDSEISVILNNPVDTYAPGSTIIKAKEMSDYMHLVITGNIECISKSHEEYFILSAGTFIQDLMSGMMHISSQHTYKALSFVRALRIPRKMLHDFIHRNVLFSDMEKKEDLRYFLESTPLFGKHLSLPVLYKVIEHVHEFTLSDEEQIPAPHDKLYIIKEGYVTLTYQNRSGKMLKTGDAIIRPDFIKHSVPAEIKAMGDVTLLSINKSMLRTIPIVYLKTVESVTKIFAQECHYAHSASQH